jgi:hypothetical protein
MRTKEWGQKNGDRRMRTKESRQKNDGRRIIV